MLPSNLINRNPLTWLVLIAIVPIIAFSGGVAWTLFVSQNAAVEAKLVAITRAMSVSVDRNLRSHIAELEILAGDASLDTGDLAAFHERARRMVEAQPTWRAIALIDPATKAMLASSVPLPSPLPQSVVPTGVDEAVRARKSLVLGVVPQGHLLNAPGIMLITPVIRDGHVRYVLTAVQVVNGLNDVLAAQHLPSTWIAAILDNHLILAGRSRTPELFVGKSATSSLADHIATLDSGMFEALNQEGDKVYTAFSRSPESEWSVVIGIPKDEIVQPIRSALLVIMAAGGVLIVITLILATLVGRGIMSRRQAFEKTINESEERYRLLIDGSAEYAIFHVSPGGLVDTWNAAAERMKGYKAEEIVGRHISSFYTPEDVLAGVPEQNLSTAKRDGRCEQDGWKVRRDGSRFWANAIITSLRDDDGTLRGFAKITRDITERKEVERLLANQSARYQHLLKTASDGIHIMDRDGVLVEANESFLRILGYDHTIIGNLRIQDWDKHEPWEVIRARNDDLIDRQGTVMFETRHHRRDGVIVDVEVNASGIEIDGKGFIYAASRDISQRKVIEAQLRDSEERFRSLVEGTTDWVWETDADHRFSWFSPSFEFVTGVPNVTILGKCRWDMASRDREIDAALWQAHIEILTAHQSFRDFRYWIYTGDGKAKWISISGNPHYDSDSNFLGYRGSGADITAQAELSMRLRMLSTAVEQSPVSVVITDTEGAIEYVNSYFTTVTGYEADEVLGENPRLLASGNTPPEVYRDMWEAICSGQRWVGELSNKRKNGQLHWESFTIAPVLSDDGHVAHYVAVKEDITERRLLRDKLRQTNAELEQFSYVASHDLRQPLRMVTSYLELIEKRLPPESLSGDIKTFLDYAVGGAKRMDRLILDLLEYSRTGKSAKLLPVPVGEAIDDALVNLTVAIRETDAVVVVADDLPTVNGDSTELTRLFQNLIGNAVKYHAPDRRPEIEIACRRERLDWLVSVSDNGIGIGPDDRERAFAIFQRLVAQDACEGSGIGLAVCKKIVEHHGGKIWIESEVGVGSTFFMTFPVVEQEPERQ